MNQKTVNIAEDHPEYFIALCVALLRRLGQQKVTVTLEEMEEAARYGIGIHTHETRDKMDVEVIANPDAGEIDPPTGIDYVSNIKPTRLN